MLCWLNHGFYLNKLSLDGVVRATALSIDKLNPPSPADGRGGCLLLNTSELLVVIERVRGSLAIANTAKFLEGNEAITAARLAACMSDLECVNYLHFVLIVLTVLRNMGARARLCVCFDTLAQSNESSQLTTTKATTSSRQLSGAKSEPNLLLINTQSKTTTTKRKSDQQKAEPVAAKKAKTTTGSGTKEEAQTEDEAKAKKKKAASILSSSDEAADKERQESTKSRSCDLRNYWLEVFVVAEDADAVKGRWCCVEPYEMKVDNAAELERRVQPRRVLYVCAYDGDNRVKDVTKRYAGDFMVATRVQRNAQLDDAKKMWWEKTLMSRQPLDVQLDIDEEKELKSKLELENSTLMFIDQCHSSLVDSYFFFLNRNVASQKASNQRVRVQRSPVVRDRASFAQVPGHSSECRASGPISRRAGLFARQSRNSSLEVAYLISYLFVVIYLFIL